MSSILFLQFPRVVLRPANAFGPTGPSIRQLQGCPSACALRDLDENSATVNSAMDCRRFPRCRNRDFEATGIRWPDPTTDCTRRPAYAGALRRQSLESTCPGESDAVPSRALPDTVPDGCRDTSLHCGGRKDEGQTYGLQPLCGRRLCKISPADQRLWTGSPIRPSLSS